MGEKRRAREFDPARQQVDAMYLLDLGVHDAASYKTSYKTRGEEAGRVVETVSPRGILQKFEQ